MIQFPYHEQSVHDAASQAPETFYRPMAKIRIAGPKGFRDLFALVDTGSDETLFPYDLVDRLGVTIRDGHKNEIRGIGGHTTTIWYSTVNLELLTPGGGPRWSARVGFYLGARSVLGHSGFLDHFTAKFNGRAKRLTLTPNQTAPPPQLT